jgi:hypothetical protein
MMFCLILAGVLLTTSQRYTRDIPKLVGIRFHFFVSSINNHHEVSSSTKIWHSLLDIMSLDCVTRSNVLDTVVVAI